MNLRFSSLKGFASIWRKDFIGHQGFLLPFLPRKKDLKLGQELEIDINVEGEPWGKVWAIAVWKNVFGIIDENTPRGIFLRIRKVDDLFEQKADTLG
ncbi:MAG: hypothetical protein ACOC0U_00660 [Desulfovibrionales bacterium]